MERDQTLKADHALMDNFNSHAHVERDPNNYTDKIDLNISTHTLTWSVTLRLVLITKKQAHFNSHAHVERDFNLPNIAHTPLDFNSHAHVERDDE